MADSSSRPGAAPPSDVPRSEAPSADAAGSQPKKPGILRRARRGKRKRDKELRAESAPPVSPRPPRSRAVKLAVVLSWVLVLPLYGKVSGNPGLAAGLGVAALLGLTIGPRVTLDRFAQLALAAVGVGAVWILGPVLEILVAAPIPGLLRQGWALVALAALFVAVPRLVVANAGLQERGDALLLLLCLLACGGTVVGPLYPVLVVAFLLLQVVLLHGVDDGWPSWRELTGRHKGAVAGSLALTALLGFGSASALPGAHHWAMEKMGEIMSGGRAGFGVWMSLGSLRGLIQSDELVLRVEGPKPELLRGIVYSRYHNGRWTTGSREAAEDVKLGAPPPEDARRITAIHTVGGDPGRYFVPWGAARIAVDGGDARVDEMGVVHPAKGVRATSVRLDIRGPGTQLRVADPQPHDTEVPAEIAGQLGALGRQWSGTDDHPEAGTLTRLSTLERTLQDEFKYALEFDREPGVDPVIDFLTRDRSGHCEYFASGFALMARAMGVPARVVGGYRVTEYNPLAERWLVRQRNAHAWVEAWVAGEGWVTFDPTPSVELAAHMPAESSTYGAIVDVLNAWLTRGWAWLVGDEGVRVMYGLAGLLFLGFLVNRLIQARRKREPTDDPGLGYSDPLPAILLLQEVLAARGQPRGPTEPLERYATRLDPDVRRYGRVGEPEALIRDIEAWLAAQALATAS